MNGTFVPAQIANPGGGWNSRRAVGKHFGNSRIGEIHHSYPFASVIVLVIVLVILPLLSIVSLVLEETFSFRIGLGLPVNGLSWHSF